MSTWVRTINLGDVFHNDDMTFEQRRDAIVRRLRRSPWFDKASDGPLLRELVDELADAEDANAFDNVWEAIYNEADVDRVWINTLQPR